MPSPSVRSEIERLRPAFRLEVERRTLSNGLTLLCVPEAGSGLSSVQFWVRSGSVHEGASLGSGLSHYLEHMVFKGTRRREGRRISAEIQEKGGNLNAYTTFDRTVYYADLPSSAVGTGIDVLADLVFRPRIDDADAAIEREVILREIDMTLDEPDTTLWQTLFETAFRSHPYRYPVIGYREQFAAVRPDALRAYHASRYCTGNVVVVVAGDVDGEAIAKLLGEATADIPRGTPQPVNTPAEGPQLGPRFESRTAQVQLSRGGVVYKIPGLAHPDAAALDVLGSVLGSGNSSVLWRELRERRRIVHEVDASSWNPGDGGLFYAGFQADAGRGNEAATAIREILESARKRKFSAQEIRKVIRQVLVQEVRSRRTVSGLASKVGMAEVVIGDQDHFDGYLRELERVDADRLREVAERHLVESRMTSVTLEPETAAKVASKAAIAKARPALGFREFEISGVPVLVEEDARVPMAHMRVVLRGGPAYETPGTLGAGSLLATLLTRDAGGRSAATVDRLIEQVGGSFGAACGNNTLSISADTLPGDFSLAVDLVSKGLSAPEFKARTLATERESQEAGLRDEADDVVSHGRRLARELLFGSHPLARSPQGDLASVPKLDQAVLRKLHGQLVRRGNLVVLISGSLKEKEALKYARSLVSRIHTGALKPVEPDWSGPAHSECRDVKLPREQSVVFLGFPIPGARHPDSAMTDLLQEFLSGMSSRLFERVREEKGLAYFVRAVRIAGIEAGGILLEAGTAPGKAGEVLKEFRDELERIRQGGARPEEVERCVTRLSVGRRMQRQTPGSRTLQDGVARMFGLPKEDPESYDARLRAANPESLAALVRTWLDPKRETELVVNRT